MVYLICGQNGSGKTQKLINHANEELKNTHGLIAYIDKSDKYRLNISNKIKFINANEFKLGSPEGFYGFLCGILSGNYDINRIYIDNIGDIAGLQTELDLKSFISEINTLSQKSDADFYITMTTNSDKTPKITELVFVEN